MKGIKKIDENVISAYRSLTITNPNLLDNSNWQVGTLKCDPAKAGLSFKVNGAGDFSLFDAANLLIDNSITSDLIKDGAIQTGDLGDKCITNDKIADRTIGNIMQGSNPEPNYYPGDDSIDKINTQLQIHMVRNSVYNLVDIPVISFYTPNYSEKMVGRIL